MIFWRVYALLFWAQTRKMQLLVGEIAFSQRRGNAIRYNVLIAAKSLVTMKLYCSHLSFHLTHGN